MTTTVHGNGKREPAETNGFAPFAYTATYGGGVGDGVDVLVVQRGGGEGNTTIVLTRAPDNGPGTQLHIEVPAAELPAMVKALYVTAEQPDPLADIAHLTPEQQAAYWKNSAKHYAAEIERLTTWNETFIKQMTEAEADRDRAREVAVALEQENARLNEHLGKVGAIHNGCPNTQDVDWCPWCRIAELEAAIEKARRVANALAGGGLIMAALDSEVTV